MNGTRYTRTKNDNLVNKKTIACWHSSISNLDNQYNFTVGRCTFVVGGKKKNPKNALTVPSGPFVPSDNIYSVETIINVTMYVLY